MYEQIHIEKTRLENLFIYPVSDQRVEKVKGAGQLGREEINIATDTDSHSSNQDCYVT